MGGLRSTAFRFYEPGEPVTYPDRQTFYRGRDEFSVIVFTAARGSVPAQSSPCDGAVDADAGGEAEPRASAAERRILSTARHAGTIDHRGGLAGDGYGAWQPRHPRPRFGTADGGEAPSPR